MRDTVDLNAERRLVTEEVESEGTDWVLPAEFEAAGAMAKNVPEPPLRRRHFLAQFSCSVGAHKTSTTTEQVPS
jgi:hypothetical protein